MMKRFALVLTGLSALALTACASLAPYGAQRGPGGQGYAEQRIESNRYRVAYNGVGPAGRVADWALVRAADLTTEQGYDWFEVTQSWTDGRLNGGGDRSVAADHNHRQRRRQLFDAAQGLDAVHPRHPDVQQDQVGLALFAQLTRLGGVFSDFDGVSFVAQDF